MDHGHDQERDAEENTVPAERFRDSQGSDKHRSHGNNTAPSTPSSPASTVFVSQA